MRHWQEAANRHDHRAMQGLGLLYQKGLGVLQDHVKAHMWFNLAASRGNADAADQRDNLARHMTEEARATAQTLAQSWKIETGHAKSNSGRKELLGNPEDDANLDVSSRAAIQEAQTLLQALGHKPGPIDGKWGPRSIRAYHNFLQAIGNKINDILTEENLLALRQSAEHWKAVTAKTTGSTGSSDLKGNGKVRNALPQKTGRPEVNAALAAKSFQDCPKCPEMIAVSPGSFEMGSPEHEEGRYDSEGPQYLVTIAKPFAIGKYEVTVDEFKAFSKDTGRDEPSACNVYRKGKWKAETGRGWHNPGFEQSGQHPVVCITWKDAKAYIRWLNQVTGNVYRLPSEAEWEYVARGGIVGRNYWDGIAEAQCEFANGGDKKLIEHYTDWEWSAAPCSDGFVYTSPVGRFGPNDFGVSDMLGNAWEWVEDCWHHGYSGAPADGGAWTEGGNCSFRMARGGSWYFIPRFLRFAYRRKAHSEGRYYHFGFRVAQTIDP